MLHYSTAFTITYFYNATVCSDQVKTEAIVGQCMYWTQSAFGLKCTVAAFDAVQSHTAGNAGGTIYFGF